MLNLNIELSNKVDYEVRCFLLWGKFAQAFWGSLPKLLTLLIPYPAAALNLVLYLILRLFMETHTQNGKPFSKQQIASL